jgi:hypothetical protein
VSDELARVERLEPVERTRLAELEAVVDAGLETFVQVGLALREIRDARLYRDTHATFGDYLDERWNMSRSRGYRLIDAAQVAELVSPMGDIPNERQARELVPLLADEAELVKSWRELKAEHGDAVTASGIRAIVQSHLAPELDFEEFLSRARTVAAHIRETLALLEARARDPAALSYVQRLVVIDLIKRNFRAANAVLCDAEDLLPMFLPEHPDVAEDVKALIAQARARLRG